MLARYVTGMSLRRKSCCHAEKELEFNDRLTAADLQVSFHNAKQVIKVQNVRKDSEVVTRLNKTKKELYPDLQAERQEHDRAVSLQKKTEMQKKRSQDKADKEETMRKADLQSYKHLMQVWAPQPGPAL